MRSILVFTFVLLSIESFAEDKTWTGFKKTENTNIPISDMILKTTFQLRQVGGTSTKDTDFEFIETDSQQKVTDQNELNENVRAFQIETCRRQNIKICPVVGFFSSSTSFIQDGNTQHFCRHSVHNWLAFATKHNNLDITAIFPPMMIKNYLGEVIYNTAYSEAIPIVEKTFINTQPKLNVYTPDKNPNKKYRTYFGLADYIIYKYSGQITAPVAFKFKDHIAESDTVYISGYPAKTSIYGGLKKGDAPGNTLVTSSGVLMRTGPVYYEATNYGHPGNSGSPAYDQNGELLGMSCSGNDTSIVRKLDQDLLLYEWEKFKAWLD